MGRYSLLFYFLAYSISVSSLWLHVTARQWLIHELTHSSRHLAWAMVAGACAAIACGTFAAGFIGQTCRRRILICCQMLLALISLTIACLVASGMISFALLLFFSACTGFVAAWKEPSEDSFMKDLVPDKADRARMIQKRQVIFYLGRVVVVLAAGALLAAYGIAALYFLDVLTCFIIVLLLLGIVYQPHLVVRESTQSVYCRWRQGLIQVWRDRGLRAVVLLHFLLETFVFVSWVLLPRKVVEELSGDSTTFAWVIALGGVGALLSVGFGRYSPMRFYIALVVCPLAMVVVAFTGDWVVAGTFYGLALAFGAPLAGIVRQILQHEVGHTRVLCAHHVLLYGVRPLVWVCLVSLAEGSRLPVSWTLFGSLLIAAGLLGLTIIVHGAKLHEKLTVVLADGAPPTAAGSEAA